MILIYESEHNLGTYIWSIEKDYGLYCVQWLLVVDKVFFFRLQAIQVICYLMGLSVSVECSHHYNWCKVWWHLWSYLRYHHHSLLLYLAGRLHLWWLRTLVRFLKEGNIITILLHVGWMINWPISVQTLWDSQDDYSDWKPGRDLELYFGSSISLKRSRIWCLGLEMWLWVWNTEKL